MYYKVITTINEATHLAKNSKSEQRKELVWWSTEIEQEVKEKKGLLYIKTFSSNEVADLKE